VSGLTRPATAAELAWIAQPAVVARVVEDPTELRAIAESEPWRVRVTEKSEAVLLARWREHVNDCAVLGLWCSPGRIPVIVTDLLEVARDQGFSRLLGPLVRESDCGPYLDAGLHAVERVVVMRLDLRPRSGSVRDDAASGPAAVAVPGLVVREATEADLGDVLAIDAASFPPFWRYDVSLLERLARTERLAVGEIEGWLAGYTLAVSGAGAGTLGRLAVVPEARGRGIGRCLADEAVAWLARNGSRSVALSTQEDNAVSRVLYRGMGFRETGDVLVACASSDLSHATGEGR
jgi:ribosomal protein S18 acetylase RimI-like enzyme